MGPEPGCHCRGLHTGHRFRDAMSVADQCWVIGMTSSKVPRTSLIDRHAEDVAMTGHLAAAPLALLLPLRNARRSKVLSLARLLLRLFHSEPEIMGLTALLLLQHARAPARLDAQGTIVLLEDQDRGLWNQGANGKGLAQKAARHQRPGPYVAQLSLLLLRRKRLGLPAWRCASSVKVRPTRMSQAVGSRGGPFWGQVFKARRHASGNASSAVSRLRE
jgi:hypothetical protein